MIYVNRLYIFSRQKEEVAAFREEAEEDKDEAEEAKVEEVTRSI